MIARCLLAILACVLLSAATVPPRDLASRVGFDQHLGGRLPMDLRFRDASGTERTLNEWAGGRPVILALGYFRCPNLCDAVWQSLAHAVSGAAVRPGSDVTVLFVSIDPHEGPMQALPVQRSLLARWPAAGVGAWHFLSGDARTISRLAASIGFRYVYDDTLHQFAHPAGVVVTTAGGRINQYLFGVEYQPQALRLAVVDASQGRLGSLSERLVLLCCGYDPSTGRYSLAVGKSMRVLGSGFALLLVVALISLSRRRRVA